MKNPDEALQRATSLRVVRSAELSSSDWSTLTDLCVTAFNEPWDDYWESIGPGVHVIAEEAGRGIVQPWLLPSPRLGGLAGANLDPRARRQPRAIAR